jgi:broad specificity phosphatase PhoE
MSPTRPVLFIRHGQTDWNVEGRMQGHTDIPLNATGLAQAHAAAEALRPHHFTRIIASPLSRARTTAEVIATTFNLPITFDDNLKERTFGSYEGMLTSEIRKRHNIPEHESFTPYLPADAEQWPATLTRSLTAVAHWQNIHPDESILFVGHGAFFRALYEGLGGPYLEAKNATPYHFQPQPDGSWHLTTL